MPRSAKAYLADIVESCDAIQHAVRGMDVDGYRSNRLVRSSVEREFTIIGEAVAALGRDAPAAFASITEARRIVDFRNQLTHEYPGVDDVLVWGLIDRDVPVLRSECAAMMNLPDATSETE
jgi:uncharacterized protein with HEPN domain